MVNAEAEDCALCNIYNRLPNAKEKRKTLKFRKNLRIAEFYTHIETQFDLTEKFEIVFCSGVVDTTTIGKSSNSNDSSVNEKQIPLVDLTQTLRDVGIKFSKSHRNKLYINALEDKSSTNNNNQHQSQLTIKQSNSNNKIEKTKSIETVNGISKISTTTTVDSNDQQCATCVIFNKLPNAKLKKGKTLKFTKNISISELYEQITLKFIEENLENFDVSLASGSGSGDAIIDDKKSKDNTILLTDLNKTLLDVGIQFMKEHKHKLYLTPGKTSNDVREVSPQPIIVTEKNGLEDIPVVNGKIDELIANHHIDKEIDKNQIELNDTPIITSISQKKLITKIDAIEEQKKEVVPKHEEEQENVKKVLLDNNIEDKTIDIENKTITVEDKTIDIENKSNDIEIKTIDLENKTIDLENNTVNIKKKIDDSDDRNETKIDQVKVSNVKEKPKILKSSKSKNLTELFGDLNKEQNNDIDKKLSKKSFEKIQHNDNIKNNNNDNNNQTIEISVNIIKNELIPTADQNHIHKNNISSCHQEINTKNLVNNENNNSYNNNNNNHNNNQKIINNNIIIEDSSIFKEYFCNNIDNTIKDKKIIEINQNQLPKTITSPTLSVSLPLASSRTTTMSDSNMSAITTDSTNIIMDQTFDDEPLIGGILPMTIHSKDTQKNVSSLSSTSPSSTIPYVPSQLAICAPSASDTSTSSMGGNDYNGRFGSISRAPPKTYIGLVNQAMTCYLNSLLQTLFMTPEFRNAIYHWEFDNKDETKSIPYQIQRLFINLQTSTKNAVETTSLTRSFGWDSSEAWQQHDIQELCRVMFDALEHKFKNTDQSNLINQLYEGKMIDYVKCLECSTEKSREDTFLDIPLPVRPFGSTIAYGSVDEALRAFVQPETLNGNNQYFCEKCNKKCDAHKGLKFSRFPYILTLHLKRFDFDSQTFNRIKLNDKVTFPQTLNLNHLVVDGTMISTSSNYSTLSEHECTGSVVKCDDTSTIDSGSAEDDGCVLQSLNTSMISGVNGAGGSGGNVNGANINDNNHHNNTNIDLQDDDEGIDLSTCTEPKANGHFTNGLSGPYEYELFSIMIHSGSASGGHYYVYIKDFDIGDWFCFNDQNVSPITQEDIQKSFGGGGYSKSYYSSSYSPSTNAYMLMYRQIDAVRNASGIKPNEFPLHIQEQMIRVKQREASDERNRSYERTIKTRIFFINPKTQSLKEKKLICSYDTTYEEALDSVYSLFYMDAYTKLSLCRLVVYNETMKCIYKSFTDEEMKKSIGEIIDGLGACNYIMIELRTEDQEFEVYVAGSIMTKLYVLDPITNDIDYMHMMRTLPTDTVGKYKSDIIRTLKFNTKQICVALIDTDTAKILLKDENTLSNEEVKHDSKVIVKCFNGMMQPIKMKPLIEKFKHLITLKVLVPKTDKETLDQLSIPAYVPPETNYGHNGIINGVNGLQTQFDSEDSVDAVMKSLPANGHIHNNYNNNDLNNSLIPTNDTINLMNELDCNSEDSSLSDSDRTLVESISDDGGICNNISSIINITSTVAIATPSFKTMNTITDSSSSYGQYDRQQCNELSMDVDADVGSDHIQNHNDYYHKIQFIHESMMDEADVKNSLKLIKVYADSRYSLFDLKKLLESHIQVPADYFKILRYETEKECTNVTTTKLKTFSDGDRLLIELGRALCKGEHKVKILYLKLSNINDDSSETLPFLCEWIIKDDSLVSEVKESILKHLKSIRNFNLTADQCRLRKKTIKAPSTICLDDQKFGDAIYLSVNAELIFQELENPEIQEINHFLDICVFVKRFYPSTVKLGNIEEVALTDTTDIITALSKISNIPEDRIVYQKIIGSFPHYRKSLLKLHSDTNAWTDNSFKRDEVKCIYEALYIYKDKDEPSKELTTEEHREIVNRENVRNDRLSAASSYSPRRERALRIYLDSPPKKGDD